MSSGRIIKNNYLSINGDLRTKEVLKFENSECMHQKFDQISSSLLLNDDLRILSKNSINQEINYELSRFYIKINEIHLILSNNSNLTNDEKLDYCRIERYFMKLYLKAIVKKYL